MLSLNKGSSHHFTDVKTQTLGNGITLKVITEAWDISKLLLLCFIAKQVTFYLKLKQRGEYLWGAEISSVPISWGTSFLSAERQKGNLESLLAPG